MLGLGAWLVIDMQASSGIMIAATILLGRALQPVEHLISGWRALADARGAWQRLGERAASAPQDHASHCRRRADASRSSVSRTPSLTARCALIRNVSFALAPGDSLGIIGASASGKTTLVRLLLGLWRPQAGCVRLDGADTSRWDRDALGEHIGYLPQSVELFGGTVGENIARLADSVRRRDVRAHRAGCAPRSRARDDPAAAGWLRDADRRRRRGPLGWAATADRTGTRTVWRAATRRARRAQRESRHRRRGRTAGVLAELKARAVTVIVVTHNAALMTALDKLALLKNGTLEAFGPSAAVMSRLRTQAAVAASRRVPAHQEQRGAGMSSSNPTFAIAATSQRRRSAGRSRAAPRATPHADSARLTIALLTLWTVAAPLSGAVIAPGKLKVELNRKTVQHQEGGIVRRILVRDGEQVRSGQPLIVVGDVRNDAELSMLLDQLQAERIRNARATAEAALAARFSCAGGSRRRAAARRARRARDRSVRGAAAHAGRADRLARSADTRCADASGGTVQADRDDGGFRQARGAGAGDQREARAPGLRATLAAAAVAAR